MCFESNRRGDCNEETERKDEHLPFWNNRRAIFMEYGQETGEGHILCLSCDRTYSCSSIVLIVTNRREDA